MIDQTTRRLLPWLVAIGFFMQTLDSTILNTALPAMARGLNESPLRMQSVVVAYMLTVALLIPASGWLADRFGTRKVFMSAIVLFSLGSLLCALSSSLTQLVASRVVQGMGGALLLPVGRLAVLKVFPKEQLLRVLSFVTIPGLIGPLVGPTLGGWLVEVATWHWVFLINIPVGVVGCFVTSRYMPELLGGETRFDWVGFALFGTGMVLVSVSLQGMGEHALPLATSLVLLFAGLAAMAGYWLHAARSALPLFSLRLFHIHTYAIGVLGNLFARLGSGAIPFLTPLFLQIGLGFPPTQAGMFMIPTVLGAMVSKTLVEPLIRRQGYRRVLVGNTLLLGMMIASFALVDRETPHWMLLLQLAVFGVINSLQFTAMNTLTLGDLEPDTASSGNSLLSVVMQLSMSLGVAAAAALLAGFSDHGIAPQPERLLSAFQDTYICVGVLSMLAACIFMQLRPGDGDHARAPVVSVEEG
ncbi:DHA2 family efflux MFS transporter permease subunit [Chitiniphilus eburneus]|uniref:DHA2 family efflux MFS transporter permease subunit n=1 Tax=Chitiniphilus eburneus TaxID=2571148 RepID=A0A4U0PNR2_9NEIS|nr:DHA2 family efflux MFS transporter permease subunit [Chitiniphilus eburneus]